MYVASASTTVKFHDFPSGNVVHNYQPGSKVEGPIRSISWSRDGTWLVLVPHSGVTEIVSTKDQLKLLKTIQDIEEPTCACFQNTTKKNIALGTKSGLVLIYDVKSRSTKKRFPRASSQITHVDFTARDTHCVAGCKNGEVLVYGNITNSPPSILRVPKSGSVNCLKTSLAKRQLVLGGSNEGVVVVWDINVSRSKFFMEAHKAPVNAVAFSPVNTDLIVSTGSDRQFCFFDIVDNKCIASVAVENSMTAVDFSPDGTYFVMASQNGRVFIYDSRNIQEPVHSFQAHKSAVKHLAFQNVQETANSSTCSISTDSNTPATPSETNGNRQSKGGRASDFFGHFVPNVDSVDEDKRSVVSMEGGDSFMAALGLDKSNTTDSMRQEDSAFKVRERLPSIADLPSPSLPKPARRDTGDFKENHFASTPKMLMLNPNSLMSPVVNHGASMLTAVNSLSANEVRGIVKEELKGILNELKADIKYQATHTTYQLRALLLDMHMAQVKEFINLENFYRGAREDLGHEGYDNGSLAEENEQLRRRIQFLEEQLKNATHGGGTSDT
ncbi:protein NEDD1 [Leptinotarsa decemlineata]|uniref:protein NEDD1 n=1 Tax=Leptinotarsa decemlineata TaxID=7539 RepID=UPI003D305D3B